VVSAAPELACWVPSLALGPGTVPGRRRRRAHRRPVV